MERPLVSIILLTYKQKGNLDVIIDRLKNQTFKDFELIVCDDGSNDFGGYLFGCDFPVRYIWQEDSGFRCARSKNNGMKIADGKYIQFLEADIIPQVDWLEQMVKLADDNVMVLGVRNVILNKHKTDPENNVKEEDFRLPQLRQGLENFRNPWNIVNGGNILFPKRLAVKVGMMNEDFIGYGQDDIEFAIRMADNGCKFKANLDAIVYHIEHKQKDCPDKNFKMRGEAEKRLIINKQLYG